MRAAVVGATTGLVEQGWWCASLRSWLRKGRACGVRTGRDTFVRRGWLDTFAVGGRSGRWQGCELTMVVLEALNEVELLSRKKHRTGDNCQGAQKMTKDLAALARAAPPPLSADDALKHARSVRPGL